METIFHFLQFAPAFLRTKMVVQEKAIKNLSVSLPTNAVSLTLENIKESKKKHVLILEFEPGPLRLQYWTGPLTIIRTTDPDWFHFDGNHQTIGYKQ